MCNWGIFYLNTLFYYYFLTNLVIRSFVYFIFPFIEPEPARIASIEKVVESLIDTRNLYPDSSLADLYDSVTMPKDLRKIHSQLDSLVDGMYLDEKKPTNEQRLSALISAYKKFSEDEQLF